MFSGTYSHSHVLLLVLPRTEPEFPSIHLLSSSFVFDVTQRPNIVPKVLDIWRRQRGGKKQQVARQVLLQLLLGLSSP